MKTKDKTDRNFKRPSLWVWLVIILLIISMPMLFSFYRNSQIQQAAEQSQLP